MSFINRDKNKSTLGVERGALARRITNELARTERMLAGGGTQAAPHRRAPAPGASGAAGSSRGDVAPGRLSATGELARTGARAPTAAAPADLVSTCRLRRIRVCRPAGARGTHELT